MDIDEEDGDLVPASAINVGDTIRVYQETRDVPGHEGQLTVESFWALVTLIRPGRALGYPGDILIIHYLDPYGRPVGEEDPENDPYDYFYPLDYVERKLSSAGPVQAGEPTNAV